MRARGLHTILAILLGGVGLGTMPAAQVISPSKFQPLDGQDEQGALPNRLVTEVGIIENLGDVVPRDLAFLDEAGDEVNLSSLLDNGRPLAVAFVYHDCPMLCSLILDGVSDAVVATDLTPGVDYDVLAVSVDPADTPQRASEVKARYVDTIGDPAAASGLHFWTIGDTYEANVQALAEATGFRYALDVRTGEYAHNAALIFLSPQGKVTRYLYGINYAERDFRLSLVEAGQGRVGSTLDRFLLTCFEYDEDAQSYSLAVLTMTKIGGGLLILVVGGLLFVLWRREVRQAPDSWTPPTASAH
ncbi:MAG: SCO family protein [Bacteroidota bacterium]